MARLPDLTTLQGISDFMSEHEMGQQDVDAAVSLAGRHDVDLSSHEANPQGVLALAVRKYFPEAGDRVRRLLATAEGQTDADLSLQGLSRYISPEKFLDLIADAFPGYAFAHDKRLITQRHAKQKHLWYSMLVKYIYDSEGPDGVSQILHHLMNKLGRDKRNALLAILKGKYPDIEDSAEGVNVPKTKSDTPVDPVVEKAQVVLALSRGVPIESIEGISARVLREVRAAARTAGSEPAGGAGLPANFAARLEEGERLKAGAIGQIITRALHGFEERPTIQVTIPTQYFSPRAFEIASENFSGQGYGIKHNKDPGGYGRSGEVLEVTEIGERLAARDRAQSAEIVRLVGEAIISQRYHSDVPTRYTKEAVRLALVALRADVRVKGYSFKEETIGGYGSGHVIDITPPTVAKPPRPKHELETLVDNLNAKGMRQLEDRMMGGKLLGYVTQNVQRAEAEVLALLRKILVNRDLFSRPVFGQYVERLIHNVENPTPGTRLYEAYSAGLPELVE